MRWVFAVKGGKYEYKYDSFTAPKRGKTNKIQHVKPGIPNVP